MQHNILSVRVFCQDAGDLFFNVIHFGSWKTKHSCSFVPHDRIADYERSWRGGSRGREPRWWRCGWGKTSSAGSKSLPQRLNVVRDNFTQNTANTAKWLSHLQSPLKLLEQQGQFLYFCCTLKTVGIDIKQWIWDKRSVFQLLFPSKVTKHHSWAKV